MVSLRVRNDTPPSPASSRCAARASLSSSACSDACCPCQVADLGGYSRPADQRRTSEILAPRAERLLRLALQFAGRQLQLGELQFDALAAGRHVRQPRGVPSAPSQAAARRSNRAPARGSSARSSALFAFTRNRVAIRRLMLIPAHFPSLAGGPGPMLRPGPAGRAAPQSPTARSRRRSRGWCRPASAPGQRGRRRRSAAAHRITFSGEYVTLPVSRRGPRGVRAGIAGSHAQGFAACLTLPGEEDCAIAGRGDYPEPRQPGTRQERMGWYGRSGTGRQ